ncbi:MAG: TRC40/GET3/ArsA family transport-energizing ATPase [Aquificaceae bacterium]|nr:TRC40/GET3/ArsA family transport-energizing ATPase [Aquificaceae bacterium]MCS7196835.1 TRC40/GET3/ArsA family transport-energizing ATPase [Aquificaceae bacterium]MCX7989200.1 TRC40/GET3/ArsA family transport-energizing ATPase [Aquificaceae bacterium]MDW8032950.1 TRC40/GET3/ArsA family transport-energizing ATPase [Aquificaceae bacterium]MDW8293908.1 TRC40/GET3/ArsA family transport-energizing ATPase [Aquificaceae bacterium]
MLLKRLVFFGGKGGVGKSTLSSATALRLSEKGRTLLVSVDPAHSLTGIFGLEIGSQVKSLKENLYAVELSAEGLVEEYAQRVLGAVGELLPSISSGLKEYTKHIKHSPTALETVVLDRLVELCNEYPFLVVDSAPTGQMLRLFETAHMVRGWFEFLFRLAKERQKVERFMGREDNLLRLIEERRRKLETLESILREKAVIFAVANEERLSIQEMETLRERLKNFRVYPLLNRWLGMEWKGPKVGWVKEPYGLEGLKRVEVGEILELL